MITRALNASAALALILNFAACGPAKPKDPAPPTSDASSEPKAKTETPDKHATADSKPSQQPPGPVPPAEEVKPAAPANGNPALPMVLVLPTDNDALLKKDFPSFYMFVDRNVDGEHTTPWEAGQYGYVRNSAKVGNEITYTHFHEGMDIAPVNRDAKGEPLDEVRSISHGEVVHCAASQAGDFGWYVVIRHDWGQGAFYSLYAHLAKITVKEGDKVEPRSPIGILGHTGVGLDKRRAHVHVELDVFLSSRFCEWRDPALAGSASAHGNYSGFNLAGLDLADLILQRQKKPGLTVADYLKTVEITWKVLTPRRGELELLQNYPWMGEGVDKESPSWEIGFSSGGVPLHIQPSATEVKGPQLAWVKPEKFPYVYHTRGYVTGSGSNASLSTSGARYVKLATGDFESPMPTVASNSPRKTLPKKAEPKKPTSKKSKK